MPLECFYTLPSSLEEHRIIWRIDPRLKNHVYLLRQKIDLSAESNENTVETLVAQALFEKLQQYPERELFRTHWIAFLGRRCEQVVTQILSFFPPHLSSAYFRDLFLVGSEAASNPVKFFEKFDEQRSRINYWYPTLKRFSDTKIKHLLMPKLRKLTGLETLGRTNLGLVARSSRKQAKEALQHLGYKEAQLAQYLLTWQCFKEVRNSLSLGANKFQSEHFQKVAERYSEFQEELALTEQQKQSINEKHIKVCLENIGAAIRQLLDPPIDSLDSSPNFELDEYLTSQTNILSEPKLDDEMDTTIAELMEYVAKVLDGLEEVAHKQTLFLRYGLELKQGQVGKELGGQPQYQVSRSLQKLHDRILSKICAWVKQNLEIEPSSEGLSEIEAVLCKHYSEQIDSFFEEAINFLGRQSRELLKLCYIVKLEPLEIGRKLHKSELEVKELLELIKQWLYNKITEKIQAEIKFEFPPLGVAQNKIALLTETRLETFYNYINR